MRTWTTRQKDRERWPLGPWEIEPDVAHWYEPETRLDCLIVRNNLGALCGYVGFGEHPLWGRPKEELHVHVHGGLTYDGEITSDNIGDLVVPEIKGLWWFGFDCLHMFDDSPEMIWLDDQLGWEHRHDLKEYRTFEWVRNETEALARQLMGLGHSSD